MIRKRLVIFTLVNLILTTVPVGCNFSNSSSDIEAQYNKNINIDNYKEPILNAVSTGEVNELFIADFYIYEEDLVSNPEIKQYYSSNNTIYLQISDKYMYRFQLNNATGLIESYLKYNLEA